MTKLIRVFGDSHVSVFNGYNGISASSAPCPDPLDKIPDQFRTYRMGPFLAYNIGNSSHAAHIRLKQVLRDHAPLGSNIMLSYGMVDCWAHLYTQSQKQDRPIKDIIYECVSRYFKTILELSKSYRVLVLGMHPLEETEIRRQNNINAYFNYCLNILCDENNITLIQIFNKLINPAGPTKTKLEYYLDGDHLGIKSLPLLIKEIEQVELA